MIDKIINEIKKNINLKDNEIALNLIKKYPKIFKSVRFDSLRRKIGTLRKENDLKKPVSYDKKQFQEDIKLYSKKYNEDSEYAIARRLVMKYPLKLNTIRLKIYEQKHFSEYTGGNNRTPSKVF